MNRDAIVHGRVCRHDDHFAPDCRTAIRFYSRVTTAVDLRRVSLAEHAATVACERARQTGQVKQWMNLCLARKVERRPRVERFDRRAIDHSHIDQTSAMTRC